MIRLLAFILLTLTRTILTISATTCTTLNLFQEILNPSCAAMTQIDELDAESQVESVDFSEVKGGLFAIWGLAMPGTGMEIIIDQTTNQLWGCFQYDSKDGMFLVDDISNYKINGKGSLIFEFRWAAKSTRSDLVVWDEELTGHITYQGAGKVEGYLGGADMMREGYIEGRLRSEADTADEERMSIEQMQQAWEALEQNPNRIDIEKFRNSYGCID